MIQYVGIKLNCLERTEYCADFLFVFFFAQSKRHDFWSVIRIATSASEQTPRCVNPQNRRLVLSYK
jgi:hypothetical protein